MTARQLLWAAAIWATLVCPAAAQQTIQATDPTTHTVAPDVGDVANKALRMICINPVSHLAESCAGSGGAGGGNVVITDPNTPAQQAAVNASGQVSVVCANCSGSGVSATDAATYTATSSLFVPVGGYFKTSVDTLSSGQSGAVALTSTRSMHISLFDNSGNALLGQQTAAASIPVILPSATITTLTPPAALTNFANETGGNLAAIKADVDKIPSQGQALAAASLPVVLTAIQQTALTPPAAITNFANETGGNLAAIKTDVDKIPSQGQALAAASMPVVLTAAQITTLTPPAAITGFFLDATFTGRMPAGGSPANGESNTNTNLSRIGGFNFIYNGSTWDRWTGAVTAASGAFASGSVASGAVASGAFASGAVASGAYASGSVSDGAIVTLGAKTDAKSTATDATSITVMQVLKQISASAQAPPSQSPAASAASGDALTECVILATASTNATNCKAGAGNLYEYEVTNTTTTVYYLRLYNTVGAPTCSSATGFIRSIPIPPAAAAGGVGGIVSRGAFGVAYATGIAYCVTGGSASTDNTNAAAGIFGVLRVK